ncbi:flagellar filament capping protein FliD [Enterobacter ludwigii]|uniref:flagellar filament capping protein FliD n=1 Tax=Enterobacter ludwigii TaxID=299767 RepID=UPI003F719EC7
MSMSISEILEVKTIATQSAKQKVATRQKILTGEVNALKTQQTALTSLTSALNGFKTAIDALNTPTNGVLKTNGSVNQPDVATVTTDPTAQNGSYTLNVTQLASAEQICYNGLSDSNIDAATGTYTITLGSGSDAPTCTVNMDDAHSLSDVASQINSQSVDGISATTSQFNGKTILILNSTRTGEDNKLSVTNPQSQDVTDMGGTIITQAKNAEFTVGGDNAQTFSSASNTVNLAQGVKVNLLSTTADNPLIIKVGIDSSGTQNQVQAFVDAYNNLATTMNSLTTPGNPNATPPIPAGSLAGNSGMAALSSAINSVLYGYHDGYQLTDFGITLNTDGTLALDGDKLNKQLSLDPQSFSHFFNGTDSMGKDGLIGSLDKTLNSYVDPNTGILKNQQSTLEQRQTDLQSQQDVLTKEQDSYYQQYVKQYTNLLATQMQMQNSMNQMNAMMSSMNSILSML